MLYDNSALVIADMIDDMKNHDRYLCIGGDRMKRMICKHDIYSSN